MKLRLLDEREVERLLDMNSCIGLMDAALRALSSGNAVVLGSKTPGTPIMIGMLGP